MVRRRRRGGLVVAVVLVGLVVGVAGGWAAAEATRTHPVPTSTRPLAASNPSVPADYLPSSTIPALGTHLSYVDDHVGSAGTTWHLQRPQGWQRKVVNRGIRWVLPGDPDWTYSVRVDPTGGSSSTASLVRIRLDDIRQSERNDALEDVEMVGMTDDTLTVTYVQLGRLKYQHTQFVPASASSPTAVFEVTSSGRIQDRAGLDALAEFMASTVTRA